jgi:hypothetical protein
MGDCGVRVIDSVHCGRDKCRLHVEAMLRDGLKRLRAKTVEHTPQPLRIKLLAAAINHAVTERHAQAVA